MSLQQICGLLFLFVLVCFGSAGSTTIKDECAIENDAKESCGYYGISHEDCDKRGCCWNETSQDGVPWCYLSTVADQCTSCAACPSTARRDCGNYETTQVECEANDCLWCPPEEEYGPWCLVNTGLKPSFFKDRDKVECGYFGISAEQCENLTCCWHPTSAEDVPWCYNSPISEQCTSCDACPPPARSDCGSPETTQEECEDNKCLWCPKHDSSPWCVIDTNLTVPAGCKAEDDAKKECGWQGITGLECEKLSCCWQPSSSEDVPWCFHSAQSVPHEVLYRAEECTSCSTCPDSAKMDCGSYGITQEECEVNKCMWCPLKDHGGPWCVIKTGLTATEECTVRDEDKEECGNYATDSDECGSRGCCWHPTTANDVPWCYYKEEQ